MADCIPSCPFDCFGLICFSTLQKSVLKSRDQSQRIAKPRAGSSIAEGIYAIAVDGLEICRPQSQAYFASPKIYTERVISFGLFTFAERKSMYC